MRFLPSVCLGILLILAGCTAGPLAGSSGQDGPVGLNVTNAANTTYTFEVFVVEGSQNEITIQKRNDADDSASPGAGLSTYKLDGDYGNVTSVKFPGRNRLHGRYVLRPGETKRSNISNLPENFMVVVVIHHNNRVVSLVSSTCDGDLVYLGVTMRYYGSDSVYDCNEGIF